MASHPGKSHRWDRSLLLCCVQSMTSPCISDMGWFYPTLSSIPLQVGEVTLIYPPLSPRVSGSTLSILY